MQEKVRGAENKDKKEGETFYESIPMTVSAPKALNLPKINKVNVISIVAFLEISLWFAFGMAEVLLFARTLLIWGGDKGGNLLSFLVYSLSYPFVLLINPNAEQIPQRVPEMIPESVSIMFVYGVIAYVLFKLINVLTEFDGERKDTDN